MTYKTFLRNTAILMLACILTLTACMRKDSTTPALTNMDDNGGYASDGARLEQNSGDILAIADAAATTGDANLRTTATTSGGCATVTHDSVGHIVTIDFGPTDCSCLDGKLRRGKIIVTYTGHYKDSGSVHTISTDNYYVNGNKVIVHKTVSNMGMNSSSQVWYTVAVNDSIILGTDSVISWTGSRTRTWLAGYSTPLRGDDEYLIGGTTTLRRASGRTFTHTISSTDPLKVAMACGWIEDGTATITSSSFVGGSRTIDYGYGGGGCDNQAQLTIGSHTYVITMH